VTTEDIEDKVKNYLAKHQLIEFGGAIDSGTDLFSAGLIDSFNYIELIRHLEREFQMKFASEEILSDVVVSVNGLTQLISSKLRVLA
jgi:acyl carrier protein